MSIPTNIEKEHLLKAIEKIDHEGITYETDSMYYDAKYNSKFYPPKLVVSFANIFANGTELDRNTFEGGINKPCFKLLEKHGFEIVTKELDTFNSEEEIKKYLSHFKNEELLQQFFEVAKIIFSFPNLTEKDKRIAFTLRKNGKQVSLNLGRKLVLAISKIKNQNSLCFYLSEKDASWAKNLPGYLKEEVFNTNPPARLLYFDASINLLQNMELISKVKTGIEELLPTVESAGQPERHNPLIYHLIMNEKVRTEILNSEVITPSLKEQVMVYEVKNSAVQNALELRTDDQSYFYWNDLTFKKLSLGDYVFVVIKGNHEVLFTQLDDKEIKINKTDAKNTYFTDLNKDYTVSGKYDQFVRLKVLLTLETPKEWKWKTLGSSETTYLSGKNINKDKADNRIANIKQLMELSNDQRYNEVLRACLKNFDFSDSNLIPEIVLAINSEFIQNQINESEFIFQKAREHFEYFKNIDELSVGFFKTIQKKYLDSDSTYSEFIKNLPKETEEYKLIYTIGKLISYIDVNAANKNELNDYDDKRTIALTGIRQTLWLKYLLEFKVRKNDYSSFTPIIKSALTYLEDPTKEITLFSEKHREMVAINLVKESIFDRDKFVIQFINFFKPYNINPKNPLNYTRIISEILYHFPEVEKLWKNNKIINEKQNSNLIPSFTNAASQQNLIFSSYLTKRYIASLATKPFVIFTGLSGSGKTKLAQTFAKWICESDDQYQIIPVGADWTNREPLLGYPNSLNPNSYVLPDNGALDLILAAIDNAKYKELKDCKPYFLILDEMNLSHVERYFADFLSGMESKEVISLYTGNDRKDENGRAIPKEITLPPNLFMVGTVNIDETTYMFSPKVLDRANTIEFRVDKTDLLAFFEAPNEEPPSTIDGTGTLYSSEFMEFVASETDGKTNHQEQLLGFFKALQPIGAEFGYRTANEMNRLMAQLEGLSLENNEHALDVAVMQKLLPKLHGSRTKLNKVLPILASFCFEACSSEQAKTLLDEVKREGKLQSNFKPTLPLSFEKIARMYAAAQENGFASYAEG